MTRFTSSTTPLLSLVLTALTLGGSALIAAAPVRAADLGYEEEIGFRPSVERRVVVEVRRVEERRIVSPAYGARFLGPPIYPRPVRLGYPNYVRPSFYGYAGYARPAFNSDEECRVISKKRVDPWGDVVIKRIRICD